MNILNKVTMKVLGKNKTRTAVTIIGIILSVAMITAVTSGVTSIRKLIIDVMISSDGDWYGEADSVTKPQVDKVNNDKNVSDSYYIENIGYAKLSECQNDLKPYLFVGGMSDNFSKHMPVHITNGRLPQSADEIIIPDHLFNNGGVTYKIGEKITLDIGQRQSPDGDKLGQTTGYSGEDEKLISQGKKEYTVVGLYERPGFERYTAPGYTALTVAQNRNDDYDVYIKTLKAKNIYNYMDNNFPEQQTHINKDLLRSLMSTSGDDDLYRIIYSLATILIVIIVFGSISLIYNSFSMSVSERTKQFGLLSSIGATRKQIRKSVTFEALFLSAIGIPIGIISGLLGLGITFKLTQGIFNNLNNSNVPVKLSLHFSWVSILAAIVIGLVTVLISAFIPSRRATKMSAIEAIRQSNDIKIKGKKVKTSKLTYKLFGFEGMLSAKNFKRNRRKYRATVVSLFMSVVLFISASSFAAYLKTTADIFTMDVDYDIGYSFNGNEKELNSLFDSLSAVDGVSKSGYVNKQVFGCEIPLESITEEARKVYSANGYDEKNKSGKDDFKINSKTGRMMTGIQLSFVSDASYASYLDEIGEKADEYSDAKNPKAVLIDVDRFLLMKNGHQKRYDLRCINPSVNELTFYSPKHIDGYYYMTTENDDNGQQKYVYTDDNGNQKELSSDEAMAASSLKIGKVTDKAPFEVSGNYYTLIAVYPYSAMPAVTQQLKNVDISTMDVDMCFKTTDAKKAYQNMIGVLNYRTLNTNWLTNYNDDMQSSRSLILLLNIFSYGFIILISLIATANVFNTISTNFLLRRREFAMLKSVGMTQRGFNKMMNFECILYGAKGLIYGIPVSILITYLIFKSVSQSIVTSFFIPWQSILIAVGSVFLVVFITMIYSMSKIKKDNPIDALKNENI